MRTIDIRTTQNVTIEYELAPLRERILAAFIDMVVVIAGYIALILIFLSLVEQAADSGWMSAVLFAFLPMFVYMGYHLLFEWLAAGQSLGKKAVGVKVIRLDGKEPELNDYLLRAFFLIIDFFLSSGILGILLIGTTPRNQRLGDLIATTTVIRLRSSTRFRLQDILGIDSLAEYEPQYPEVQRLSEEDMLLVKSVINRVRLHRNQAHLQARDQLVNKLAAILDIPEIPRDKTLFLRTLLRDYIVLTR